VASLIECFEKTETERWFCVRKQIIPSLQSSFKMKVLHTLSNEPAQGLGLVKMKARCASAQRTNDGWRTFFLWPKKIATQKFHLKRKNNKKNLNKTVVCKGQVKEMLSAHLKQTKLVQRALCKPRGKRWSHWIAKCFHGDGVTS